MKNNVWRKIEAEKKFPNHFTSTWPGPNSFIIHDEEELQRQVKKLEKYLIMILLVYVRDELVKKN